MSSTYTIRIILCYLRKVSYVRLKITIGAVLAPPTDLYRSDGRYGTTHNLLVDLGYIPFEVLRVKEVRDHGPKEFFRPVTQHLLYGRVDIAEGVVRISERDQV
jgi:hypothetical protein